jgi:hypothetical protein
MAKLNDDELEGLKDFVSPGRLTDPFGDKSGVPASRQSKTPRGLGLTERSGLLNRADAGRPKRLLGSLSRQWPCYVSPNTEAHLEKCLADGKFSEDDVPTIMKIAMTVAQVLRRNTITMTDLTSAIEFRSIDNLRRVLSGEVTITMARNNPNQNSGMMDSRQLKMYWTSLAQAVLAKLEPEEKATT